MRQCVAFATARGTTTGRGSAGCGCRCDSWRSGIGGGGSRSHSGSRRGRRRDVCSGLESGRRREERCDVERLIAHRDQRPATSRGDERGGR